MWRTTTSETMIEFCIYIWTDLVIRFRIEKDYMKCYQEIWKINGRWRTSGTCLIDFWKEQNLFKRTMQTFQKYWHIVVECLYAFESLLLFICLPHPSPSCPSPSSVHTILISEYITSCLEENKHRQRDLNSVRYIWMKMNAE